QQQRDLRHPDDQACLQLQQDRPRVGCRSGAAAHRAAGDLAAAPAVSRREGGTVMTALNGPAIARAPHLGGTRALVRRRTAVVLKYLSLVLASAVVLVPLAAVLLTSLRTSE